MNIKQTIRFSLFSLLLSLMPFCSLSARKVVRMSDFGIVPEAVEIPQKIDEALKTIREKYGSEAKITIKFKKGVYKFEDTDCVAREYYVSNHDQNQPKRIGIDLSGWKNLTIDGGGAEMLCYGRMLPLALGNSENCVIKNLTIDFAEPHIVQVEVVNNDAEKGITFRPADWVNWRLVNGNNFETFGKGWKDQQRAGIAFEKDTHHMVYNTSDLGIPAHDIKDVGNGNLLAPHWRDQRLVNGTIVAMRTYARPAPGIFLYENKNTTLKNVKVHYAEGMGLLAQRCDGVTLKKFNVCLRKNGNRYFTTQADATHFSQCKGHIKSTHGLYEAMMDDAINIHGVYLKVTGKKGENTLVCNFQHNQAYGFPWGDPGDSVVFVRARTMQNVGKVNVITSIEPVEGRPVGTRSYLITFKEPLPKGIGTDGKDYGLENLTWTPTVEFSKNVVRNNRARGALFSSPRRTVCEKNLFDHTSGTAILLCGDCNGWYESGAVRDLIIRKNTFINALTNMFQFTNAVISIYPEIPNLKDQTEAFHGGSKSAIRIENNLFKTFDAPLLYAKSVKGITFLNNKLVKTTDYKPFHWNKQSILLENVSDADVEEPILKK